MWRSVFWSFRRGSWQYDLIVIAILAFIFLTPREFFGDEPRPAVVREMQHLGAEADTSVYWVDSAVVEAADEESRDARILELLGQRTGRKLTIVSVEETRTPSGDGSAYVVYARP